MKLLVTIHLSSAVLSDLTGKDSSTDKNEVKFIAPVFCYVNGGRILEYRLKLEVILMWSCLRILYRDIHTSAITYLFSHLVVELRTTRITPLLTRRP